MKMEIPLKYPVFYRIAGGERTNWNEQINLPPSIRGALEISTQWIKFAHCWDGVSWKQVVVEVCNRIQQFVIGYSCIMMETMIQSKQFNPSPVIPFHKVRNDIER